MESEERFWNLKKKTTDDPLIWKTFMYAILLRAVQDRDGKGLALENDNKVGGIAYVKREATRFLNSEYCQDICEHIGIDVFALREAKSIKPIRVNVDKKDKPKVEKKPIEIKSSDKTPVEKMYVEG